MLFRRPEINVCKSKLLFKLPETVKPAATCPLPRGGGLGRGHSPSCGNLSQHLHRPNTSLGACCPLSSSLPRGERTGWLLELRVLQGKQVVQVAFLLFRRPEINVCKSKLLFKLPETAKPAATCPLPRGGGLGRGHSPSCGNLSQHLHRPNTSLGACCPLSSSLPRGERTGWLLELRVLQGKQVVQVAFLLFRRPEINVCKSKLLFKLPETAKPAATCPLPRGGGLGRGHSPSCGNLSQHLHRPNTSLAACCPLSNSLPRERG